MPPLHVVALISGGKDSFFSMLHCLEHGHKIVALANLYPDRAVEDLDSFMYQTVGHMVIPLYEQALGLPLYRQAVSGHAVSQAKTYEPAADSDEVEALIPLLTRIKAEHPSVNAVSTGAILSDYQRTRVESVALRLGLTPISYLWQYPRIVTRSPTALLEDMLAVGQDSRIIKVSSGGLDSSYLWDNVADAKVIRRLVRASQQFGTSDDGAALGEGGEYETLSLSGPAPLWKGKIVVEGQDRCVAAGEAGSSSLHVTRASVENFSNAVANPAQPDILEARFEDIFTRLSGISWLDTPVCTTQPTSEVQNRTLLKLDEYSLFLGNWTAGGANAAEQTQAIMQDIKTMLANHGHDTADIAYTSIVLRDMADFATINPVYAASFARPNPPARATIACAGALEPGEYLSISVTSVKVHSNGRQGLHVQSISYWAPANIGPYSQAITVPSSTQTDSTTTFIAGQIPLVPASMLLDNIEGVSDEVRFLHQAVLSLQHLHRIANATSVQAWQHAVVFIVAEDAVALNRRSAIARRVWLETHQLVDHDEDSNEDEADFDVWHLQQQRSYARTSDAVASSSREAVELVAIHIDALPRGADVEWVGFGTSKRSDRTIEHYRQLLQLFGGRVVGAE